MDFEHDQTIKFQIHVITNKSVLIITQKILQPHVRLAKYQKNILKHRETDKALLKEYCFSSELEI